ncbi:MAG: aspartyl protease family protein [Gracilimonas sp.]|nr:aspartyl protease family protein [Gracilimonas sp.]
MLLLSVFGSKPLTAQSEDRPTFWLMGDRSERLVLPFELINNLVVIEAKINGSEPMKFIVDSGAGRNIITSLYNKEIFLNNTETVLLAGLGEGERLEAFRSTGNMVQIERISGENVEVLILKNDVFKLASFMGTEVHGILGFDLFDSFAVEIDYRAKLLKIYDPIKAKEKFERLPRHRKWFTIPISVENEKPYTNVSFKNTKSDEYSDLKLLLDTGASNSLSFYDPTSDEIVLPENTIGTLLGIGLSGNVSGELGRIQKLKFGPFEFEEPVVAYPDSLSVRRAFGFDDRNGSIGGDLLRRFKVIFNYHEGLLYLRKNKNYNEDFTYNVSGIEVTTPLPNLPYYEISFLRKDSPARKAGLQEGDVIRKINGKRAEELSLNDLLNIFQNKEGSRIRMTVYRDTVSVSLRFDLKDELHLN